jgi:hypothetical protein
LANSGRTPFLFSSPVSSIQRHHQSRAIVARVKHDLYATVSLKQVHCIRAMAYEIRRGRRLNP